MGNKSASFLEIAAETGVTIKQEENVKIWEGPVSGKRKPEGPLAGKTVGVLIASEFSDFQAYYMTSYVSEFGGKVEFILVDWIMWKSTRPNVKTKGVHGMWGMSVDPIPVLSREHSAKPFNEADPEDYDALVILGGHSADVMVGETKVIDFITAIYDRKAPLGAIGGGSIPLIRAGIMEGRTATGNRVVSYMLARIGKLDDGPVVRDGQVITARDTIDTPASRRLLQDLFSTEADILPDHHNQRLLVNVHRASRPAADQALARLFEQLNAAEIIYPGTDLRLVYDFVGPAKRKNGVTSTSKR